MFLESHAQRSTVLSTRWQIWDSFAAFTTPVHLRVSTGRFTATITSFARYAIKSLIWRTRSSIELACHMSATNDLTLKTSRCI